MPVLGAGCLGRDWIVKAVLPHVSRAGAWIARKLMDGEKKGARLIQQDRFRAVAVMHIEVKDSDSLPTRQSFQAGNRNVVEVTKPHRARPGGVVPGRAHQAEHMLSGSRRL